MYFPRTPEYALRAMAHIARLPERQALRAVELSKAADIPLPYLSKILRRLVLAGLLTSRKGHGGGFVLARPPKLIRFLDILTAADYTAKPASCAFGWGECDPNHPCPLHPAWSELKEQFLDWAARTTLQDLRDAPDLGLRPGAMPGVIAVSADAQSTSNSMKSRKRKKAAAAPPRKRRSS